MFPVHLKTHAFLLVIYSGLFFNLTTQEVILRTIKPYIKRVT